MTHSVKLKKFVVKVGEVTYHVQSPTAEDARWLFCSTALPHLPKPEDVQVENDGKD